MKLNHICNTSFGRVKSPSSKSHSQRLILNSFFIKNHIIENVSQCDDVITLIEIIKKIGFKVKEIDFEIFQIAKPKKIGGKYLSISVNESGFLLRTMSFIIPYYFENVEICFNGSLIKRNKSELLDILKQVGFSSEIETNKILIKNNNIYNNQNIVIENPSSSQYISGLIYLFCIDQIENHIVQNYRIEVKNGVSLPYINLTINGINKLFNNLCIQKNNNIFVVCKRTDEKIDLKNNYKSICDTDWSNIGFLISIGLHYEHFEILIPNSNKNTDYFLIPFLQKHGCNIKIIKNKIIIKRSFPEAFTFDLKDYPDLFPPLISCIVNSKDSFIFKNTERLINKESNRLEKIICEFRKIGYSFEIKKDSLIVKPEINLKNKKFYSYNDHRIANAIISCMLFIKGNYWIDNVNCINKSFPNFLNIIKNLSKG